LENCHFFLPNVFTPNADGINDYFSLIHEDPCIHYSLNIEIYDRWGNCVYQAFKIDFEWDGKHHDLPLSTGVYVWHLSYRKKAQGILFHEFGDLTIIR
jgi:gliding motility-associated-like protein